ncbi:response regulator, partial [Eisenbergiella porci]
MIKAIVVDDEILTREGISANIPWEKLGYELVAVCADGREARDYVQGHEVDVVLTDICMPYMDGLQLSEFLYHEYPQIKIIIFSGYDEFEYAKQALKYQVSEYLLKPVTASELSGVLIQIGEKIDERRKNE